jgi:hypothetical protein
MFRVHLRAMNWDAFGQLATLIAAVTAIILWKRAIARANEGSGRDGSGSDGASGGMGE